MPATSKAKGVGMDESSDGASSPFGADAQWVADRSGLTAQEAEAFMSDQNQFGHIVGELRRMYPERLAHAQVLYEPPSFEVRFVGQVPSGVSDLFVGLSFPMGLFGGAKDSEASLDARQDRISSLLQVEGVNNYSAATDTERGVVLVVLPEGFVASSRTLQTLLSDPSVEVTTTREPVLQWDQLR